MLTKIIVFLLLMSHYRMFILNLLNWKAKWNIKLCFYLWSLQSLNIMNWNSKHIERNNNTLGS